MEMQTKIKIRLQIKRKKITKKANQKRKAKEI